MNLEGWRKGGGVRGGASARRGTRRLTLAPSLRRELFQPDPKADEDGDELHRRVERVRRELDDVVAAVVAMGRAKTCSCHAVRPIEANPVQVLEWP